MSGDIMMFRNRPSRVDWSPPRPPAATQTQLSLGAPSPRKVPREEIERCKTERGGFTKKLLAQWGIGWPPPAGWRRALENGEPIPQRRGTGA